MWARRNGGTALDRVLRRGRPRWSLALLGLAAALFGGGCGGGDQGPGGKGESVPIDSPAQVAARQSLSRYGWTPVKGSVPAMACSDDSYARAVRNGLTYGTYSARPYSFKQGSQVQGNEWDLLVAAANYAGITKVTPSFAPFDSLIPALRGKRIDLMPAHVTPERLKVIAFTAPVYWYGPMIAVRKGNPQGIRSFQDLTRPGVTVGVVNGSAAQIYMNQVKGRTVTYQDQNTELAALSAGRQTAVLDDAPAIAEYMRAHADAGIQLVTSAQLDQAQLEQLGYGYFVWGIRKEDCTLNMALSRALGEIRAHGVVKQILRRDGLGQAAAANIPGT